MWRHPHELVPVEYELVKYIMNNEIHDDDGNSVEELHQRIADYESDIRKQELDITHMAAVIREQDSRIALLTAELDRVKKELAICKGASNT
jgi:uncharacterized small protein (DUF1192 family)